MQKPGKTESGWPLAEHPILKSIITLKKGYKIEGQQT